MPDLSPPHLTEYAHLALAVRVAQRFKPFIEALNPPDAWLKEFHDIIEDIKTACCGELCHKDRDVFDKLASLINFIHTSGQDRVEPRSIQLLTDTYDAIQDSSPRLSVDVNAAKIVVMDGVDLALQITNDASPLKLAIDTDRMVLSQYDTLTVPRGFFDTTLWPEGVPSGWPTIPQGGATIAVNFTGDMSPDDVELCLAYAAELYREQGGDGLKVVECKDLSFAEVPSE